MVTEGRARLRAWGVVGLALAGCHSNEMLAFRQELDHWSGPQPHIALRFVDENKDHDPTRRKEVALHREEGCREALGRYSYVLDSTAPIQVTVHMTPNDANPYRFVITSKTRGQLVDEPVPDERADRDRVCERAVTRGLALLQTEDAGTAATTPEPSTTSTPTTTTTTAPAPAPAPSTTSIASTAGCTKDTDCKGDRICNAGVCASPAKH